MKKIIRIKCHVYGSGGLHLKMKRLEAGVKQTELAEKLGVSQTLVSQWEKGKKKIARKYIEEIDKALKKR